MNIHVQVFACIYVFSNHAYIPMSEIAGFHSKSMFGPLRNCKIFSKEAAAFYMPTSNV